MGPGGIVKGNYDPKNLSQDQRQWLWGQFGHSGNAPIGYGGEGGGPNLTPGQPAPTPTIDPLALAGSLQQMQINANQPSIQTLQGQQSSLKDQYSSLLNAVLGQGSAAQNYTIGAAAANLGARGILPTSQLGQQTIGSALIPVTAQNQAAAAQVGMGSAQDLNQLAAQIAGLQAGNVPGAISAAPGFAGLSMLPSQIALTQAQAGATRFVPIPGYGIYDIQSKQMIGGLSGIPGQGVTNVNGVPSVYIP